MKFHLIRRSFLLAVAVLGLTIALVPQPLLQASSVRDLRICVDRVGALADLPSAAYREMIRRLERVMRDEVTHHRLFTVAGYGADRWSITSECPTSPALLTSGQPHPKNGGNPGLVGRVVAPTGVRAYVFIVAQDEIDRMFGTLAFNVAWQELVCVQTSCSEEATAFYVSPETLARSDGEYRHKVALGLEHALGLEPVVPLTEDHGPQHK